MDIIDILLAMKVSGANLTNHAAGAADVIAYMAKRGWIDRPVMASDTVMFTDNTGKNIYVW